MIWLFITTIPNIIEGWLDRKGEKRKGKVKDTIWLSLVAVTIAGVSYYFERNVENVIAISLLFIVHRVCWFDYYVHALLKRYSPTHKEKNINIWTFTGTTTYWWDQLISKVPPVVRLVVRVFIFIVAVLLFLFV